MIPLYFNDDSLRDISAKRSQISELVFRRMGFALDYTFPPRPASAPGGRTVKRVGILDPSVGHRTETYATLPLLNLDRTKYRLYFLTFFEVRDALLAATIRANTDRCIVLPKNTTEMVNLVRQMNLDYLIVGTNLCTNASNAFFLCSHRIARYQIASYCSPATTGMRTMDAFLSGTLTGGDEAQEQYTEKLICIPGPPGCLDFSKDKRPAVLSVNRSQLRMSDDQLVFASASNFFKIIPEMQETWGRLLKAVPNSRLLLHPFNPNWSQRYPVMQFRQIMQHVCRRFGIDPDRIVISDLELPSRADVKVLIGLGDVYLDTFPFSGSVSLADALEAGLPTIVMEGKSLRARQGAALLHDLGLSELVCKTEDEYVEKAIQLAGDPARRASLRQRIAEAMAKGPRFLNPKLYAQELGSALERVGN
jgi:predicted O-linked N-acetylglucosamine transferase (SPINDLY family)